MGPMDDLSDHKRAVELLQQLGLKEYEAKCFVALCRLPKATAKEISEASEVPRTRVYDAIRVLESKGLVEIQHSSPQQYRGVPIEEAAETIRREYDSRVETLQETLENVGPVAVEDAQEVSHEVWAISGPPAIENRTRSLVEDADREVVLVAGREAVLTDELVDALANAKDRGIDVVIGAVSTEIRDRIGAALPSANVFVSGLEWLNRPEIDDGTVISRLLLVDRDTILVSSATDGDADREKAVFGQGFENGIVVIARRLMATGLAPEQDPEDAT